MDKTVASQTDMNADIEPRDRGEPLSTMEPLLLEEASRHRPALNELAFELIRLSAGFRRSLPPAMQTPLASLVRAMNCYYSNLIEGHDTHPIEIERALKGDYSQDKKKRDLQLEAQAHITVQQWIDEGGLPENRAVTVEGILEIHRRFCERLPDDLLWVENPGTKERAPVVPGELRKLDVRVGQHVAVSPGALTRFLSRFEQVYGGLGKAEGLMATAAAHHRLLWMHPFLDGNGRVARLMSHATLLSILDTGAVWSVARGLARNVQQYKSLLSNCDTTRRNDLDGRGTLSEEALAEFTRFFLTVCIDQVRFMENLIQPDRLRARILVWANEEIALGTFPAQAVRILEAVLHRGELPRGDVDSIVDTGPRQGRRILSVLVNRGVLASDGPRAPVHLAFPADVAQRWMPGLFPDLQTEV
jgi:Fic family protein